MFEVVSSTPRFQGAIFKVVTDQVTMPDGEVVPRDVVYKSGAVAVAAVDDQDRIVLIRQYRHAVRKHLWELPAGLIDVEGEALVDCALRELIEETDLTAAELEPLVLLQLSPGFTDEFIQIFLARDLAEVPVDKRHVRRGEEADIQVRRVPLGEAVDMVLRGEITNAATVAGVLAAARVLIQA